MKIKSWGKEEFKKSRNIKERGLVHTSPGCQYYRQGLLDTYFFIKYYISNSNIVLYK